MKLAILLVLTLQVLSLRLRDRKTQLSSENSVVYLSSYVDPIYYSYTPIYYTYYSSPYYYYYYEPSSYVYPSSTLFTYFRKGEPEQKKEKSPEENSRRQRKVNKKALVSVPIVHTDTSGLLMLLFRKTIVIGLLLTAAAVATALQQFRLRSSLQWSLLTCSR